MMLRRTPCVGTCSTTYGDLVCRGCKRFSHEIVEWNGFDPEQRRVVWERLLALRSGAVSAVLELCDESRLRRHNLAAAVAGAEHLDAMNLIYEILQRLQWREPQVPLEALGAQMRPAADPASATAVAPEPAEILALIDLEFYRRSLAQYERNFRISPQ